MEKKISLILMVIILITAFYIGYIKYTDVKIEEYLKYNNGNTLKGFFDGEIKGAAKVVRIVKRSPTELIMIIKWDNSKAYVIIENWLTRAHDSGEISVFDNTKSMRFYE